MILEALKEDLKSLRAEDFVAKHIFDRVPFVFSSRDELIKWKTELSRGIDVDPASMIVVGSSAIGFSLNPYKNFKSFDEKSDVDVAVISHYHFQVAWRYLRSNGNRRHGLKRHQKIAWDEHVSNFIYWGVIATDKLLPLFPFASEWLPAISKASSPLIGDREVKVRIYSDCESLRAYQNHSVRALKNTILTA